MPLEESTPAIVLRARDYSESDRIVTLLTENFGKLAGIATGPKASRRRFERKLVPFSQVILYFRRRPHVQLISITRAEPRGAPTDRLEDHLCEDDLRSEILALSPALTTREARAGAAYPA